MRETFLTIGRPGTRCALLARKEIIQRISSYLQASVSASFTGTKERQVSHPASVGREQRRRIARAEAGSRSRLSGTSTTTPNTDSSCPAKLPHLYRAQWFGFTDTQKCRRGCYVTTHDN